jgi:outer membrane receptor protein involved in Fe transport
MARRPDLGAAATGPARSPAARAGVGFAPSPEPPEPPEAPGVRRPARRLPSAALAISLALALSPAAAGALDRGSEKVEIGSVPLEALLDLSVASVSRREEPTSRAAASVFVLTAEDIRRHGFRTVADALSSVPGLFVYHDDLYPMVGVRGMGLLRDYDTRLLVLVDGHPMNNTVGIGQSYVGRDLPVPLLAVQRIEVMKGPAGNVYGPTAFRGVVNIVTTGPGARGGQALAELGAAQGEVRSGELAAAWAGEVGDLDLLVSASGFDTGGLDQVYPELALDSLRQTPPGGRVSGVDFGDAESAYLRARWRGLSLNAGCGRAFRTLPSAPYSSLLLDRRNQLRNENCFAQADWSRSIAPGLVLGARGAFDEYQYADSYAYPDPPEDFGRYRDTAADHWFTGELRADYSPTRSTRLAAGAAVQAHRTFQHAWDVRPTIQEDPVNGVGIGVIGKSFRTVHGWLLAEQGLPFDVTLQAGLTYYFHELFGSRFAPKVAGVWQATRADTLKAVYSEGFRAPTAAEAFFADDIVYIANPDLRPETIRSLQLIYERRLFGIASVAVSLFEDHLRDLIEYETVPAPGLDHPPDPAEATDFRTQARNTGSQRLRGAELAVTLRAGDALQAFGGVSAQEVEQRQWNFPQWTANLALSTRALWHPLVLALHGSALAGRTKDPASLLPGERPTVDAALTLGASAAVEVPGARGLVVELHVTNLLDSRVVDPVPIDFTPISEMGWPGRSFRLGLRWRQP